MCNLESVQWFVVYLYCNVTSGLHLFTELATRPHWDRFPITSSSPILSVCSPHTYSPFLPHSPWLTGSRIVKLPQLFSSVCAPASVPSHSNISIPPHLPPIYLLFIFFVITELKCGSFHCKQCQESMLNTHTCRHTHIQHETLTPPENLRKLDQDNAMIVFVYLPWSLLCCLCLTSLHKACSADMCIFVCICMHAWLCKVNLHSPEDVWRAFVFIPEGLQVHRSLHASVCVCFTCLVCLEL